MKICGILIIFFPLLLAGQTTKQDMQLDSIFQKWFSPAEPGGAVLLVKDGQVIYEKGFGVSDIHTREAITPTTLFNVGSITKTFVAYGILQLASEGKLSLDDPIEKYFPDFKNKIIANKVRLYHLLSHTSGIPDSRKVDDEKEFYLTAKDEQNFAPLKQTDTLQFEPGTRYHYSNPAFNGLALIIQQVSKEKWQDYIRDHIFLKAGMQHSTITDGPYPQTGVSHAYIKNNKGEFEELDYGEEPTFAAAGNGGVWSNVRELWMYEKAIQGHLFLPAAWIEKSRTLYPFPEWKDSVDSRLGLSWFITTEMNQRMIGHTGSQGGFISDYCWLPDQHIFYVLLCNFPKPIKDIRHEIFTWLGKNNWLDR